MPDLAIPSYSCRLEDLTLVYTPRKSSSSHERPFDKRVNESQRRPQNSLLHNDRLEEMVMS